MRLVFYVLFGYLSGSVLYARVFSRCMNRPQVLEGSDDGNPGTANAFKLGGFWCGALTLVGDLAKGFLPVFLYCIPFRRLGLPLDWGLMLVLAAPVLGHILPVFYHFHGGKGIAVSFGCLLGLLPWVEPVLILVAAFLFFTLVIRIKPDFYCTAVSFIVAAAAMFLLVPAPPVRGGFAIIALSVCLKLHSSKEERGEVKVSLRWRS